MIRALFVCLLGLSTVVIPITAAQEASTPSDVTFEIADTVLSDDVSLIQESVRFADAYIQRTYGVELTSPVRVRIGMEENPPTVAYAGNSTIFITPDHPVWLQSSPLQRVKIVVHEFFHLVQEQLTGTPPGFSPIWLIEGSAEFVAFDAMVSLELIDMDTVHDKWVVDTLYGPVALVPLQEVEAPVPEVGCCMYSLVPLAIEHLISQSGKESLAKYFDYVGTQTWENAFAMAFRMSPDAFYESFAIARGQFAPVGYDLGMFQSPGYRSGGAGDVTIQTAPANVSRSQQAVITGWTVPGVSCSLWASSGAGAPIPAYDTFADATGFVFWLWTPSASMPAGETTLGASCGGASVMWETVLS